VPAPAPSPRRPLAKLLKGDRGDKGIRTAAQWVAGGRSDPDDVLTVLAAIPGGGSAFLEALTVRVEAQRIRRLNQMASMN
jgi:hypothetical protein